MLPYPANSVSAAEMTKANDPYGFCDLFWGENLEDIQKEYQLKFLAFDKGLSVYGTVISDVHEALSFKGRTPIILKFRANKLSIIHFFAFDSPTTVAEHMQKIQESRSIRKHFWINQNMTGQDHILESQSVQPQSLKHHILRRKSS